ncbi:cation diffusion facilitator family transporter [Corynebacterium sp. A21]|uniref:cation diffusion facilitator family transporter n=1 Tax=Corynebacterium sp. A21 TaxID=3457318 RepID=UPI003FD2B734
MTAPEQTGKNGRDCGLTRPQGGGAQQHHHEHGASDHGHDHSHAPKSLRALVAVIVLTSVIFLAELIGGLVSGSMALLADAMHMLSDSTGLIIALVAMLIGRKSASSTATYGYRRVEVLAAMLNAGVVTLISVWVVVQAVMRLGGGTEIDTDLMLIVAVIGFLANGISALVLMRHQDGNINMRGAFLHVLSDMLASVAVIIAGLVIRYTGWMFADTIASLVIAAIILPRSLGLLRDAVEVLLERVPRGVDTQQLEDGLLGINCVREVHDLHVWSLDGKDMLATVHLVVDGEAAQPSSCLVLDLADEVFAGFGIGHSTIQLESPGHQPHEGGLELHH